MRILIAGCGYVGRELARELVARGDEVFAGSRRPRELPDGVTPFPLDLTNRALALPDALDAIVFAAAPDQGDAESYERIYVEGLRHVLEACDREGQTPRRTIFVSSTAVYAAEDGEDVDETSATVDPTATTRGSGTSLRRAEELVLARPEGVVVRLAGIYGPGRNRIVRMVRDGEARCAHPAPIGNRIHRDDCAGVLAHVLSLAEAERIYLGVDHAPVELCEVYRWIAGELAVAPPPESDAPDARGRGARKRCSNARLVASGYRFRFPTYREGYRAIIDAERGA